MPLQILKEHSGMQTDACDMLSYVRTMGAARADAPRLGGAALTLIGK